MLLDLLKNFTAIRLPLFEKKMKTMQRVSFVELQAELEQSKPLMVFCLKKNWGVKVTI